MAVAFILYHFLDWFGVTNVKAGLAPVLVVGPVEEVAQLAAFLFAYPLIRKEMNEPTDGLLYMACVAFGFSFIVNFFYAVGSPAPGNRLFMRILICRPSISRSASSWAWPFIWW